MRPARTGEVIVVGGGVVGLCSSLLLARDGHRVRLLERDPAAPPPRDQDPWGRWERRGVNQFQLLHAFLPRFRELLDAELPDVTAALEADGAARVNRLADLPDALTGGRRPGDERFDAVTGRRPMVEATLARLVDAQPGVEVRRGVAVRGLRAGDTRTGSPPHVGGVVTEDGGELQADAVIDASGRRTRLPSTARRPRRSGALRGARGHRVRLLLPPLPRSRRVDAGDDGTAPPALRLDLDRDAARRPRHVGGRHRRQWGRPRRPGRPRS